MTLRETQAAPSPEAYVALRAAAGLGERTLKAAQQALPNTLFATSIYDQTDQLIAMGRVVGDAGCFVQLVDIAVHPDAQGQGLGRRITASMVAWCETNLPPCCHVSLVSSERAVPLYTGFGFEPTRGMDRYAGKGVRLSR